MREYAKEVELWLDEAACKGMTDLFYAAQGETTRTRELRESIARQVCESCVVRRECLDYAINNNEEYGIWGGMNEPERRSYRRRMRRSNSA